MDSEFEILLITESLSTQHHATVSVWDLTTKNSLQAHKGGGIAGPHLLDQICDDFIITSDNAKPILHIWPVNSQNELKQHRLVIPSIATALAVCPHSVYLAVGINTKLYVWHLSSGRLLTVEQKHFQPITCIKFSSTGDYVIVGGSDGKLVVWKLSALVSVNNNLSQSDLTHVEAVYSKMNHTASITDIHVGIFGNESIIATVSLDSTASLCKLSNGKELLHIISNECIMCVTMDKVGWNIYLGMESGNIQKMNLRDPPRNIEYHVKNNDNDLSTFVGHKGKVNSLSLSVNCQYLVSGSNDCKVIVWDVESHNMLFTLSFKSAITNVKISLGNKQMFAQEFKPKICMQTLQRSLNTDNENYTVSINQEKTLILDYVNCNIQAKTVMNPNQLNNTDNNDLLKLRSINHELYQAGGQLIKQYYNIEEL